MLKAEHITKQYQIPGGGHTVFDAVSDVSIELGDGGVTAIVGESGSGKSTLARVLSYVERPDGGRVFLDGLEVSACRRKELRAVRGKVQLVMQNALGSLDPHQSVASILEEPLRLLFHMGAEERKQRCLELLDMARLERDTLRRRPDELSGGQQKRLCIARALAAQPQHIIFDESFSGLDVTLKKQVLDFLKELQTELQISFLVITHDLDTAMYMACLLYTSRLTPELGHLLSSAFYTGMFEVVIHDMPKDQAVEHIHRMRRFYTAGWKTIFFGDGGENH